MRNLGKRLERLAADLQPKERVWIVFAGWDTPKDEVIRNAGIEPHPSDLVVILQTNFQRKIDGEARAISCRT